MPEALAELWWYQKARPRSSSLNVVVAVEIQRPWKMEQLRDVWEVLVGRHPILKSHFMGEGGRCYRVFPTAIRLPLGEERFEGNQMSRLQDSLDNHADAPFDMATGPLWRVFLFSLGAKRQFIQMIFHHSISDFRSVEILWDEMVALIDGARTGVEPVLGKVRYNSRTSPELANRASEAPETDGAEYNEHHIGRAGGPLPQERCSGRVLPFTLDRAASRRVSVSAQAAQVTPFVFLLATFQAVLRCYFNSDRIAIHVPASTRQSKEAYSEVGYFIHLLPVAISVAKSDRFVEILGKTHCAVLNAIDASPKAGRPVFRTKASIGFVFYRSLQNAGTAAAALRGHELTLRSHGNEFKSVHVTRWESQFDLKLSMASYDGEIKGALEYDGAAFDVEMVEGILESFIKLLDVFSRRAELSIAGATEAALLHSHYDGRCVDNFPSLIHRFDHLCLLFPAQSAVVDGDRNFTYGDLYHASCAIAAHLRANGVCLGETVGVHLANSFAQVATVFAILRLGAVYLPIDISYPNQRK